MTEREALQAIFNAFDSGSSMRDDMLGHAIDQARAALARPLAAEWVQTGTVIDAYSILSTETPFSDGTKVQRVRKIQGDPVWAVRRGGNCLNKSGAWEWEPMPSSRCDEFMQRCRFASADEAIAAALTAPNSSVEE